MYAFRLSCPDSPADLTRFLIDPSVTITSLIAQLLALPFGKLLELLLPTRQFRIFGYKVRSPPTLSRIIH